jgi:hypothetical protein
MYPWVVISWLAKRLEKPPFYHSYTSFGVWPRDHYMSLQRFTMGRMPDLAKVVRGTISILRFNGVVHSTTSPLAACETRWVTTPISHSSEQGTLPTTSLISKQAVPYRHMAAPVVLGCLLLRLGPQQIRAWLTANCEGCNLLHRSKLWSNHSIKSHHGHLTSRHMEDQHSQHSTQAKLNIIKMERLVRQSWL